MDVRRGWPGQGSEGAAFLHKDFAVEYRLDNAADLVFAAVYQKSLQQNLAGAGCDRTSPLLIIDSVELADDGGPAPAVRPRDCRGPLSPHSVAERDQPAEN